MMSIIDTLILNFFIFSLPMAFVIGYFYQGIVYLDDLHFDKQKANWKKAKRLANANFKFLN